ncbi:hypothetical protein QVD17_28741 [Tagetes erecta]|uniref:F-box associated beta-propeller type 1 domain-containing protein n=1 Tax=Tagetes erecta TaxID=13708 RepID=A0AAD8KDX4_TARER|nr:hypothetical protein QVD17_28741 [Tagetes erecta]
MNPSTKIVRINVNARGTTSIDDLPTDILSSEILVRLPAKCIGVYRTVSKQWLSLLSSKNFILRHCRHISTSYKQMFFSVSLFQSSVFPVTFDPSDYLPKTLIPLPTNTYWYDVRVLTSFDGLVCLSFRGTQKMILWNPLTHATKFVSSTLSRGRFKQKTDAVGLYVSPSNEYMLLHAKRRNGSMKLYKYSSRCDSWRKMGFVDERKYHNYKMSWSNGTFFQGVVYFIVKVDAAGMGNYLFGFHVDSDELKSKPKPATTKHDGDGSLVVVRNQLHMFVANSLPNWSLHLWRMDGENWTKIWVRQNILPPSLFGRTITYVVSTGKFLVVSRSGTVFEIDTTKNGIECYHPVFSESSIQGAVYTETLMSPDF